MAPFLFMRDAIKRALDIAVSLPMVLGILPFLVFITYAFQCIQSPGPIFYVQKRVGRNRKTFPIFKFRSMHLNDSETKQATQNDSRVYAFGRFLRKTSLDEFPQFLNVLLGHMSVSGPRPILAEHDKAFSRVSARYSARYAVKPGITGLAQAKGLRGEVKCETEIRSRLAHDLVFVRRWSLRMELMILALTALQVIRPAKSAY